MHYGLKSGLRGISTSLVVISLIACNGTSNTVPAAATTPSELKSADPPSVTPAPPAVNPPLPSESPPSSAMNDQAPQISGTPPTKAVVGQTFSFQPNAVDSNGAKLTFSVSGKPLWTAFDTTTGHLWGTPRQADLGARQQVVISVSNGIYTRALPQFALTVVSPRKSDYGHYFATHYSDTPADAAKLCEHSGVTGVVWRQTWNQVEPSAGSYDFGSFDKVLAAIADSRNPRCQLWLFVEFKSFGNSPVKNPCPVYLQARHSGPNSYGRGAATCFMWEQPVVDAYVAMMKAAAARYDSNPRVEGLILQESSLGFNDGYSQDVGDGGTYTAAGWRDALIQIIGQCANAFSSSRCMSFLNFLRGGQQYLNDISAAISAVPNNQVCFSGPDLLPNDRSLYDSSDKVYQVLTRHSGCRSNSAQNDSYHVSGCSLDCIFHFAVSGTLGAFPVNAPLSGGVCVNSYLFWNDKTSRNPKAQDYEDALAIIAAHPYGRDWLENCIGSEGEP
jgi:putative Ig domain-containing protein